MLGRDCVASSRQFTKRPAIPIHTTTDGTHIFYKDLGDRAATPIVFSHCWPLSSDEWDAQLLYFQGKGYRVIAHDRRGHGRSTQTEEGNDMDTYVADLLSLTAALDLKSADGGPSWKVH
jgi:non-heme chloroperoxidase